MLFFCLFLWFFFDLHLFQIKQTMNIRLLLSSAICCTSSILMAQTNAKKPIILQHAQSNKQAIHKLNSFVDPSTFPSQLFAPINPTVASTNGVNAASQSIIGLTVYDLQTNSSVQNRVQRYDNGFSAIWTFGSQSPAFPDRGMAYQYINNAGELLNPEYPTNIGSISRVENVRTGFGSLNRIQNGSEIIISHSTDVSNLILSKNNGPGTQNWINTVLPFSVTVPQLWARSAVGGNDGKTVHLIAVTEPVTLGGTPYQGIDGALVYNRSLDGGNTWDITNLVLPGMDSTLYKSFSADEYAIAARGNTVAFVFGGFRKNWVLMKSTDNGNTWTKKIILPFPVDAFDDTQLIDSAFVSDGSLALVIDNNDIVHSTTGRMEIANTTLGDSSVTYFPGTIGLYYWNELFINAEPTIIAGLLDEDEDGTLNISLYPTGSNPSYQSSATSFPSMAVDADGNLWITYAAIRENYDLNGRGYRHIYALKSSNGTDFEGPADITPFDDFTEYAYACMPDRLDNNMHVIYMSDELPGIATIPNTGNSHPYGQNFIIYQTQPLSEVILSNSKINSKPISEINLFPNPASNFTNLTFEIKQKTPVTIEVFSLTGQKMFEIQQGKVFEPSLQQIELNITDLASGIYFVSLSTKDSKTTQKLVIKK